MPALSFSEDENLGRTFRRRKNVSRKIIRIGRNLQKDKEQSTAFVCDAGMNNFHTEKLFKNKKAKVKIEKSYSNFCFFIFITRKLLNVLLCFFY